MEEIKEAYIYTYVHKETLKTYIGSRIRYKGSCYDDFNIKYFSSSKDPEFRQDLKDGKLEGLIILIINCKDAHKKILDIESKMIQAYWEKFGKENSYNHYANGKFNTIGIKREYKPFTLEHKDKIRLKLMGNKHTLGYKHSEETKKKIGKANKGNACTEETKKKISLTKKSLICEWLKPDGTTCIMNISNAKKYHKDWTLLKMTYL